jgi:hypothetical protein
VWVATEKGKRMPLDREPYAGTDPHGLFVIRRPAGSKYPVAVAVSPDAFPGELVYRSHFTTCPHAGEWRRRQGSSRLPG